MSYLRFSTPAGSALLAAGFALVSTAAFAQCDFQAPLRTRAMTISMVRNHAACESPDTAYRPNVSGWQNIPACSAVAPATDEGQASEYDFNSRGNCTIKLKPKLLADCSGVTTSSGHSLPTGPCHVTSITGKCEGIELAGIPIHGGNDGWALRARLRFTVHDPDIGDITLVDPPFPGIGPGGAHTMDFLVPFLPPVSGSTSIKATTASSYAWRDFGPDAAALPPCTSAQILDLEVLDPLGLPFARMGFSTMSRTN